MSAKERNNSSEEFNFPTLHAVPNFDDVEHQETKGQNSEKDPLPLTDELQEADQADVVQEELVNSQDEPVSPSVPEEKVNREDELITPSLQEEKPSETKRTLKKEQSNMEEENTRKPKNKKNSMITKVLRLIRRIFFGGVLVVGVGMSYIWADQNGYITMISKVFQSEETTSEIDVSQNELITKLQLNISDIKRQISQNAENSMQANKAQSKVINELNNKYAQLKTDLDDLRRETANSITLVNGKLKINEQGIQSNKDELTSKLQLLDKVSNQITESKEVTNANSSLLNRLQIKTNTLSKKISTYSNKTNAIAKSINKKTASKTKQTASPVATPKKTQPVIKEPAIKTVSTYSGLSVAQTFHWSTQVIAVLSDSMGTNIQITKGDKLGEATVVDVKDSYVSIKDDLTGEIYKLTNGNY